MCYLLKLHASILTQLLSACLLCPVLLRIVSIFVLSPMIDILAYNQTRCQTLVTRSPIQSQTIRFIVNATIDHVLNLCLKAKAASLGGSASRLRVCPRVCHTIVEPAHDTKFNPLRYSVMHWVTMPIKCDTALQLLVFCTAFVCLQ